MPIYKIEGKKKDGLQGYKVRINYIADNGEAKQLTRTAYGLEAAKSLERRLCQEVKNKEIIQVKKITVQQLFDEYVLDRQYEIRESTLEKKVNICKLYIMPTFEDIRIDKITVSMIRDWKLLLERQKLSFNTKRVVFIELRLLIDYAVKMEYLPKNPLEKIGGFKDRSSIKKEINYYTQKEFEIFISTARNKAIEKQETQRDLSEWNYYVFFNIAFYTGCRLGEINALKWSDIDGAYLSVKRSIAQMVNGKDIETPPKNKSSIRTLQMPLPLIEVLNEHKARQKQLEGFSYDNRICGRERCLRDTTITTKNGLYAKLSELKVIRIHDYRHSHASVLANEGINIQEIARRLGHSRIEMTWNTYSHLYPREEEKAVAVLNKIG